MWAVYNGDDRVVKTFTDKDDAEEFAEECNHKMQTCGFYVKGSQ